MSDWTTHRTHARAACPRHDGSVLIVVMWVCLGLVSVALMFAHSMLMTYRGADNALAGSQAEQAIEGAVQYAEYLLANSETPGALPDVTSYHSEWVPVGEASFWFMGRSLESDATAAASPVFGLVDEASKLNINTASQQMLTALGIPEEFATSIVEWRTAETDSTSTSSSTTPVKHAPFETIEELALVAGADQALLYGEDANFNGVLDPNEDDGDSSLPADNGDGKLDPGILEYVTVFSRDPKLESDGSTERINITNADGRTQLWTKVEEVLGAEKRQTAQTNSGTEPFRSVLQFYIRSEMAAEDFSQIRAHITASSDADARGFVNAQTASELVLTSVVGTEKATKIVAARLGGSTANTDIAWLRNALGGSKDEAAAAAADLTLWSYQTCADVAAVGRNGRGFRRARVVIDQSQGTPQIIYRRDLSPLGWALGSEVRQTFATRKETL